MFCFRLCFYIFSSYQLHHLTCSNPFLRVLHHHAYAVVIMTDTTDYADYYRTSAGMRRLYTEAANGKDYSALKKAIKIVCVVCSKEVTHTKQAGECVCGCVCAQCGVLVVWCACVRACARVC